ncbi:hypothetical protein GJU40_15690 [Bacillus lacus]|uniref:Uncharacterized protein n=1 Tax=Metabacillus lacus TaxID=1983721 RepID=A0A7X2J1U8_9BACI|nr:hypothetical protein [Metabacillus lacus]MRX73587.1 hypothetical protein [Metabacillus lacus]
MKTIKLMVPGAVFSLFSAAALFGHIFFWRNRDISQWMNWGSLAAGMVLLLALFLYLTYKFFYSRAGGRLTQVMTAFSLNGLLFFGAGAVCFITFLFIPDFLVFAGFAWFWLVFVSCYVIVLLLRRKSLR